MFISSNQGFTEFEDKLKYLIFPKIHHFQYQCHLN